METRVETDLLGTIEVPSDALWGAHTARAVANFPLSGRRIRGSLVRALAMVKKAACRANAELGYLPPELSGAIERACDEIIDGGLCGQFPVDALQGGAGTSANMNLNEVIANRALELLGVPRGSYDRIHPIETVNLHQSTNDVFPTAVKVAAILGLRTLSGALALLQGAFQQREKDFAGIVKMGRTELQEAVPLTLGAEFSAFAEAFARDRWRTFKCEERLRVVNLGGTAIGTGLTAPRAYIFLAVERLRDLSGLGLTRAENLVEQTANADAFAEVSGMLEACACDFVKVAGDLRLLHLLGEIRLPACQAGSSVMPGKVNPVVMEAVIQGGLRVRANHGALAEAVSRGSLQINEFLPLIADSLLDSIDLLTAMAGMMQRQVELIEADREACRLHADRSVTLVTAFLPSIGYERAEALVKEFRAGGGRDFRAFLAERLGRDAVEEALTPAALMALGHGRGE